MRRYIAAYLIGLSVGILSMMAGGLGVVAAHPANDWFPEHWPSGSLPDVGWKYHSGFPSTRGGANAGMNAWNGIQPNQIQLIRRSTDNNRTFSNSCADYTADENIVYHMDYTGPIAGVIICPRSSDPSKIKSFFMLTNSAADFDYATDHAAPNNEYSMEGIMAHEAAHTTGWTGHFFNTDMCPRSAFGYQFGSWQTMCTTPEELSDGQETSRGKDYAESLEGHDEHTFDDAY